MRVVSDLYQAFANLSATEGPFPEYLTNFTDTVESMSVLLKHCKNIPSETHGFISTLTESISKSVDLNQAAVEMLIGVIKELLFVFYEVAVINSMDAAI